MTHPHDLALLYDLIDGRLAPAAAEELRRRLDDEPALRATWEELRRMRDALRALPSPAVPDDFLARVRVRAGLAPSEPAAAGPERPASREAPILRLRWWSLAAAAGVGLALGAGVWLAAGGLGEREAQAPVRSVESARERQSPPPAAEEIGKAAGTKDAPVPPTAVPVRPGGGIPPALRAPTDTPPTAPPTGEVPQAPDAATGLAGDSAAGLPPPPTPAPSAPAPRRGAVAGRLGAPAGPPDFAPPAPPLGGAGGGAAAPAGAAEAAEQEDGGARADGSRLRGATSKRLEHRAGAGSPAPLEWARRGADEVLILRAASLDEARAEIGLFLAASREDRKGAEAKDDRAAAPPSPAWEAPGATAPTERDVLGSFLVTLDEAAWRRVRADVQAGELARARAKEPAAEPVEAPKPGAPPPPSEPGAPAAPPPPTTAPAPAPADGEAPDAAPAKDKGEAGDEGKPGPRTVRILVVR